MSYSSEIIGLTDSLRINNYNNFFHENMCHVCKKLNNGSFISCDMCDMISYCNSQHRLLHRPQHMQICEYIHRFLRKNGIRRDCALSLTNWIQLRQQFLSTIKKWIPHKLKPYEEQMILFAKSCSICHRQINLEYCRMCYSDYYCREHIQMFQSLHKSKCKQFILYININVKALICDLRVSKFTNFPKTARLVDDMETFITTYLHFSSRISTLVIMNSRYFYCDYVSGPLTFYFAMKNADLLHALFSNIYVEFKYVIHVVALNALERKYLNAWEILLHLLHHIKDLTIVLVGPNFQQDHYDMELCYLCRNRNVVLHVEIYNTFYHIYVAGPFCKQPNVIIEFQADFNNEWTCSRSIFLSQIRHCPLILTATSAGKAEQNVYILKQVLGSHIQPLHNARNPFKSLRPWRNLETGSVYFRNDYVTVYRNTSIL